MTPLKINIIVRMFCNLEMLSRQLESSLNFCFTEVLWKIETFFLEV
jgi:hypothetical protein